MPINPNIALGIRPIRVKQEDPFKEYAERSQLQALMTSQADDELTRTAMRESGGDTESALKRLISGGGSLKAITGLQGMADARAKAKSEADYQSAKINKLNAETGGLKDKAKFDDTTQALQYVFVNPSVETLQSSIIALAKKYGTDPTEQLARVANLQTPDQIKQYAGSQILKGKELLSSNQTTDVGGRKLYQTVDPLTNRVTQIGSDVITESEAQRLAREQKADEAAKGRSNQWSIAKMADDRARELNETTKSLGNQEKQLRIQELQGKIDEKNRGKDASISSIENQIGVIDKALTHKGRETATGLSGAIDPRNYVWGTNAADFKTVLDQIGGAAFLQAFESLKGGGAITEVEGKKATDAMARLNRAQSDDEFKSSLDELRGVMTTGYKRLSGKDYGGKPGAPKPAGGPKPIKNDADYNALPSGAEFIGPDGKTRRKP